MKNKLFYLVGIALLMCSTGMFTSCINGVDDEYLELQNPCTGGGTSDGDDENSEFNGEYFKGGDYDLVMKYNGDELNGKKVTFLLNDDKKTATLTLAGTEKDLSSLSSILDGMGAQFTTYSPIPGEKELLLKNVKIQMNGATCLFEGEDIKPTRTVSFNGEIKEEVMTINIQHMLVRENNDLLGKWKMGEVKETGSGTVAELLNNNDNDPTKSSPLFLDWGSDIKVDMGNVATGLSLPATIHVNRPMTGIFNLLMSQMVSSQLIKPSLEQALPKLVEYIAAEQTGGMYASYSWNGTENPIYSQDMSHSIIRYYFDKDNKLRIEADADYILNAISGLIDGGSTRAITRAQPDEAKVIGKELINKLRPALEQGFPCEYTIDGNNLTINLDGAFLLDIMKSVEKLVNDPFVKDYLDPVIKGIGDYAPNVTNLLENLHNALGEDCKYIKLGLRMVKIVEETPEEPEQ